jgi:ABC-type nitrate/sulfonate/bicarbonate transport system substrate-binding protein
LAVELLDPSGEVDNSTRVADGDADFSLSRVAGHLVAASTEKDLAARFVSVIVRRSPIGAFVPATSPAVRPADLSGLRVAGAAWAMAEFVGGMTELGLDPAVVVPLSRSTGGGLLQEACAMLARGGIDAVADYEDLLPRARRHSGIDVRSVNLGLDVYSSGLVAADRLSPELVERVVGAVVATLERQRRDPERGVVEVVARTPRVVPDDAREGWRLVEPRIFTGDPPGSMAADRWATSVAYLAKAHRVAAPAERIYRSDPLSVSAIR